MNINERDQMQWYVKKLFVGFMVLCVCLFLVSCAGPSGNQKVDPFAGDWQRSGTDSEGNEFNFAAKVIDQGNHKYRVLVLDSLDTMNDPMHVMDGVLKDNQFPYTADEGLYTGGGALDGDIFKGWYKGSVDGTYQMQRVR